MLGQSTRIRFVELVEQVRVDQPASGMIGLRATQGAHTTYKAREPEKVAASGRRRPLNQPVAEFSPRSAATGVRPTPAADSAVLGLLRSIATRSWTLRS